MKLINLTLCANSCCYIEFTCILLCSEEVGVTQNLLYRVIFHSILSHSEKLVRLEYPMYANLHVVARVSRSNVSQSVFLKNYQPDRILMKNFVQSYILVNGILF